MTKRDRMVLLVVGGAALLAAFWFLMLAPKRHDAGELASKVDVQKKALTVARSDVAASRAARAGYATNYATVARLGKAVPTDDDVPSLLFQLESTANRSAVDFRSLKLSDSAGQPSAAVSAASASAATQDGAKGSGDPASGASGASGPSGATGATGSTGATGAAGAANVAQAAAGATAALPPGAVVGPAGLSLLPFDLSFEGSFFNLAGFLHRIESYTVSRSAGLDVTGRLLTINGFSLQVAESGFPRMSATLSANSYLLPADQGLTGGATPGAPAAGGASQPVSGSGGGASAVPATATGVTP